MSDRLKSRRLGETCAECEFFKVPRGLVDFYVCKNPDAWHFCHIMHRDHPSCLSIRPKDGEGSE